MTQRKSRMREEWQRRVRLTLHLLHSVDPLEISQGGQKEYEAEAAEIVRRVTHMAADSRTASRIQQVITDVFSDYFSPEDAEDVGDALAPVARALASQWAAGGRGPHEPGRCSDA